MNEVKCKQCGKMFKVDQYDEQTAHGWFCSNKCLSGYANDTEQTEFMVLHGCGPNCNTAARDGVALR